MEKRARNAPYSLAARQEPRLISLMPSVSVKTAAASPAAEKPAPPSQRPAQAFASAFAGAFAEFAKTLQSRALLVTWSASGMTGQVAAPVSFRDRKDFQFSESVASRSADFGQALDEVLNGLRKIGIKPPKTLLLASSFIVPARIDLPINPQKPRPKAQMWALCLAEMETPVSEAGAAWTIGAVLAARGVLTQKTREDVALELSLRRAASSTPCYFGQVACDLGLISRHDLDEALRLQEKLQSLDARLACGWVGRTEDSLDDSVWLGAATALSNWKTWEAAARARRLTLAGALPFALTASETPDETGTRLALEVHAEEIMLTVRTGGRITTCQTENRMGRPLDAQWFSSMSEEWRNRGIEAFEIVCLDAEDAAKLITLRDELAQVWDKPIQFRHPHAAQHTLLKSMARVWRDKTASVFLPRIRFGTIPAPVWKNPIVWRTAAPLLTLCAIGGVHIQQHAAIKQIQARFELENRETEKQANVKKAIMQRETESREFRARLQKDRELLAQLLPEVDRMSEIERMTKRLPGLLRMIAQNIGDDVVLDALRGVRAGRDIGHLQVVGWSSSYTGAQSFALNMQQALAGTGYAVAGAEVKPAKGRMDRNGYQVVFWLLPSAEELDASAGEAQP